MTFISRNETSIIKHIEEQQGGVSGGRVNAAPGRRRSKDPPKNKQGYYQTILVHQYEASTVTFDATADGGDFASF